MMITSATCGSLTTKVILLNETGFTVEKTKKLASGIFEIYYRERYKWN